MPTYDYTCQDCKARVERWCKMDYRHSQTCALCGGQLALKPAPVYGRVMFEGRVLKGGGPDRFTADALGIKDLRDLPAGLRSTS